MMGSSRTGPGAGARRSLLMLPLLGPGRRICGGGICRFYFCCRSSRRCAAACACCCCRSRARGTGRTCRTCTVGRHGMFPGGRLRMMILLTRRMTTAIAARVRVVMMGSTYSTAGRCICVREAAPAVVIVRIRRGRSGAVSGQRTRRCHRSRRGGQGGHLSMIYGLYWDGRSGGGQGTFRQVRVYLLCQKQSRRQSQLMEQRNPRERYFLT